MDFFIMLAGFTLASYSVVGNDVIQTLGTFLTSNENKLPWWGLWLYAGGIMAFILILGYFGWGEWLGGNDVAFDRLDKIVYQVNDAGKFIDASGAVAADAAARVPVERNFTFWYLLPPLILLFITRLGIPVSTTFLVLTFFSSGSLPGMLNKSLFGYAVAFVFAWLMYVALSAGLEKVFLKTDLEGDQKGLWTNTRFWTAAQWLSTGFLWSQWLSQDLANIYVYLGNPETLSPELFFVSLAILLSLLAFIFYQKGGTIQNIVRAKSNTADIRSATFIDLFYGIVLLIFKQNILGLWDAKLPMSTTWVFLGILAGRELAMRMRLGPKPDRQLSLMLFSDLGKAALGLVISVVLVVLLFYVEGRDMTALFSF